MLEHNYLGTINWETGELVLRQGEREIGLRLGLLRADGEPMWWEWLRVEEQWAGPGCRALRVAGYASAMRLPSDHSDVPNHHPSPWTHRHHWLFCEAIVLLFANGVVHITARHVNNRLYDYGRDVPGLPIIAFRCGFAGEVALTGEAVEIDLGGARLSPRSAALASPEHPGALTGDGEVTIFRPTGGGIPSMATGGAARGRPGFTGMGIVPVALDRALRAQHGQAPARVAL